jgi:type IV pilus assembly protein PilA
MTRTRPTLARGFTWIEMTIVLAVISILALMAIPALQDNALKRQVKEGLAIAALAKNGVQLAWSMSGELPADNKAAGIPDRAKIVSTFVKDVNVDAGAVTLTFGNNASKALEDKKVTVRPALVPGERAVPLSWLCHTTEVPKGMEVQGRDETDIPSSWLPIECRGGAAR